MRKLRKLDAENLSSKDYIRCKNLTYRSKGHMSDRLIAARNDIAEGRCYLIEDDNKLLAWALVYNRDEIHIYVRKSERKKGLASRIIKHIEKDFGFKNIVIRQKNVN